MSAGKVKGVHLVGSIPVDNEEEAFRRACQHLPNRIKRLPDGETQSRWNFTAWQSSIFRHEPRVLNPVLLQGQDIPSYPDDQEDEVIAAFQNIETHYEDHALSSYATFQELREQGIIPNGVRFQVSLPSPLTVMSLYVRPALRSKMELLYQRALLTSLKRIENGIPAQDLAIQWDCVFETMMIEEEPTIFKVTPWFQPVSGGIAERLATLVDSVDEKVEVGLHLCYGDSEHKHLVEPRDLGIIVNMANTAASESKRNIDWIHMPVPKSRTDRAYFEPLQHLKPDPKKTDIVLGLVHAEDLEGTKARIETGGEFLAQFLVATECGMGRTPRDQLDDILSTSAKVCS